MTALQLERKLDGKCKRCDELAVDTDLCPTHERLHNEEAARSLKKKRDGLRELELCVDCRMPSKTYRCAGGRCGPRLVLNTGDGALAI